MLFKGETINHLLSLFYQGTELNIKANEEKISGEILVEPSWNISMEIKEADVLLSFNAAKQQLQTCCLLKKVPEPRLSTPPGRRLSICLWRSCEPRLARWRAGLKMIFRNKADERRVIRRLGRWGRTSGREGNHMTQACERATFITAGCTRFWRLISVSRNPFICRVCVMILLYKKKLPVSHLLQISTFMYCSDTKT